MTPHARRVIRYLAHHGSKETARGFRISERQVNRILNGARWGNETDFEVMARAKRRERHDEQPVPLWPSDLDMARATPL